MNLKVVSKRLDRQRLECVWCVLLCACLLVSGSVFAGDYEGEHVLYRYTNEDGIKVIDDKIPPKYAQQGYELINTQGHVVRKVGPTLTLEEVEEIERQKKLAEWDKKLLRRYSSVGDVEAAKARRLAEIETSMAILRGNILSMDSQIAREQAKAAERERLGQPVPEAILVNINNFKAERAAAEAMIETREVEYQQVVDKFDRDIDRFKIIQERLSRRR